MLTRLIARADMLGESGTRSDADVACDYEYEYGYEYRDAECE